MTCNQCVNWAGIGGGFGRCRAHPPTIIASMVPPVVPADQINERMAAASQWPVTKTYDYCGDFTSEVPC